MDWLDRMNGFLGRPHGTCLHGVASHLGLRAGHGAQPERCAGRAGVESGEVWFPVRKRAWRGHRHAFRSSFDKTGIYWTIFE